MREKVTAGEKYIMISCIIRTPPPPHVMRAMKSKTISWTGLYTYGREDKCTQRSTTKISRKIHKDLVVDGRIILKRGLKYTRDGGE
jgi:hypothetical protein